MKKETVIRKLDAHLNKISDSLADIAALLEIDTDDDELAEMSVCFREQIESSIHENPECNYEDIVNYIHDNL